MIVKNILSVTILNTGTNHIGLQIRFFFACWKTKRFHLFEDLVVWEGLSGRIILLSKFQKNFFLNVFLLWFFLIWMLTYHILIYFLFFIFFGFFFRRGVRPDHNAGYADQNLIFCVLAHFQSFIIIIKRYFWLRTQPRRGHMSLGHR